MIQIVNKNGPKNHFKKFSLKIPCKCIKIYT